MVFNSNLSHVVITKEHPNQKKKFFFEKYWKNIVYLENVSSNAFNLLSKFFMVSHLFEFVLVASSPT